MQTAKAQIGLRIHTTWSGSSVFVDMFYINE